MTSKYWLMTSEEQVCVHGAPSNLPGIQGQQAKEDPITNVPAPETVSELKSFLGMINYYQKFLPNMSSMLVPFNELLREETRWHWSQELM